MIRRGNAARWPGRSSCWPGSWPCQWLPYHACRNPGGLIAGRCLRDLPEGERQAAGLVVLLHRPELDDPWTPRRGEADLIVAKHQAGPTDVVTAVFQGQYSRFAPMATHGL